MTYSREKNAALGAVAKPPRIKLASLTERKAAATGAIYFSGLMGNVRLLMFRDRDWAFDPSRPDALQGWALFIDEATVANRAKQRATRTPAHGTLDHDIPREAPKPTLAHSASNRKNR
jgi:hypothetical protein